MDRVPDDFRKLIIEQTLYRGVPEDGETSAAERKHPPSGARRPMEGNQGQSLGDLLEQTLEQSAQKQEAQQREFNEARREMIESTDPSMVKELMDKMYRR